MSLQYQIVLFERHAPADSYLSGRCIEGLTVKTDFSAESGIFALRELSALVWSFVVRPIRWDDDTSALFDAPAALDAIYFPLAA